MTFTLNATVTEVIPTHGGHAEDTLVTLVATAGEEVSSGFGTMQAVYSNTEGVIQKATIALTIEGTDPPLAIGDVVTFNGHFSAPVPVKS